MDNLQKAFEIAGGIERIAGHIREDLECHNPGNSSSIKPDLSSVNLDAATCEAKLSQVRSLICEVMLCS